ncbi:DIL domain-containing protein, partial [Hamiltosporidium magnivora]
KGDNDKGSNYKGDNDKGSCIKGDNDKGSNYKGDNDKGSCIKGDNDKGSNYKGDSNKDKEQDLVNNSTNTLHPSIPIPNNTTVNNSIINIFNSLNDKTFLYKIGKTRIFFDYKLLGLLENKRIEYYKKHKIIVKGVILYLYLEGVKMCYNRLLVRVKGDIERRLNERSMDVYDISNRCYTEDADDKGGVGSMDNRVEESSRDKGVLNNSRDKGVLNNSKDKGVINNSTISSRDKGVLNNSTVCSSVKGMLNNSRDKGVLNNRSLSTNYKGVLNNSTISSSDKGMLNNSNQETLNTKYNPALDKLDFNILQETHNNSTDSVNIIKNITPFNHTPINNTSSSEINILKHKLKKYENFYKIPCKNCRALEVKYKAQTEALKDRNNLLIENESIKKELNRLKKEINRNSVTGSDISSTYKGCNGNSVTGCDISSTYKGCNSNTTSNNTSTTLTNNTISTNNSITNTTSFDQERRIFLLKIQKLEEELKRLKTTPETPKIHFSNPYEIIGCLLEAFIQHCPTFTTDPLPKEEALSLAHTLYQSVLLLMNVRKDPSISELIGVIVDSVRDRIPLISNDIYKVCFILSNVIELKCIINNEILRHSKEGVSSKESSGGLSNSSKDSLINNTSGSNSNTNTSYTSSSNSYPSNSTNPSTSTNTSYTNPSTNTYTKTPYFIPFCSDGVICELEEVIEVLFTCMVNYYRRVLMDYIPYSIIEYQGLKEFKCKEGFFNGWGGGGVSINKLVGVLDWMYGMLIFYCLPLNFCMEGVNYILKVINSVSFNALLVHKGVLCLNRGIQINNNLNFIEKFCRDIEYSEGVLNMGHIKSVVKLVNYVNAGAKLETIMDECSFLNVLQVKILFSKFKKEECCYEVKVADFSMEKFIREPKVYVPGVKEYSYHTFSVPRFLPSKYISSILGNI